MLFLAPKERSRLRKIEAITQSAMEQVELPTLAEVSAYRAHKLLNQTEERHKAGHHWVYENMLAQYEAGICASEGGDDTLSSDDTRYLR